MKWFVGWSEEKINLDDDDVTFVGLIFWGVKSFGHQLKSGMHSKLDINTYTHTQSTHTHTYLQSTPRPFPCVCLHFQEKVSVSRRFLFYHRQKCTLFFIRKKNPEKGQKVRSTCLRNVHSLLKYFSSHIWLPTHIEDSFLKVFLRGFLVG